MRAENVIGRVYLWPVFDGTRFPLGLTHPRLLLRLEGGALLVAAVGFYWAMAGTWWVFLAAFLAPDLAILAYLVNARAGSVAYNATHTTIVPLALAALAAVLGARAAALAALIWLAHIGLDRLLGLGLKYAGGFRETHLGKV